jgi:ATP-binding cassette subfamily F protein uup
MLAQKKNRPARSEEKPSQTRPKKKKPAKQGERRQEETAELKLTVPQQHQLKQLPKEIERLEFEIGRLKTALSKPGFYEEDPKKFTAWSNELAKREKLLVEKEEEWLELEVLAEELADNS